jgi:phospholipase C
MSFKKSLFCASAAVLATALNAYAGPPTIGAKAPESVKSVAALVDGAKTATPIKHLVIIYDENVSFDHYFGTYPTATNPPDEPVFTAPYRTPAVNNLVSANLLSDNPNDTNTENGDNAANPFRLDYTQAATADQNHSYTPEQQAYDNGLADLFPTYTGSGTSGGVGAFGTKGQVMGYFDGNTVTAMWQYAAHFAMNDNAYSDTYGPSTPGALEVVSGQTNGLILAVNTANKTSNFVNDTQGGKTLINDVDPAYDTCSSTTDAGFIAAKNIGDLLNAAKLTWGGFMGGFDLQTTNTNGSTGCSRSTVATAVGAATADYIPHHNWFQYFISTSNPTHARPASLVDIGFSYDHTGAADPANHEYDLNDFYSAVAAGDFPSVSYIKLIAAQDAHAGYSDPIDEQQGVVQLVDFLEKQKDWKNTAVIITYDDSDGWYDHAYTAPTRSSYDATADQVNGAGVCGTGTQPTGISGHPVNGRCGPGTRVPFIVISPWAKKNYVDSTRITQSSVVRFIEDNWLKGERLGGGSFDATDGSIMSMFDFKGSGKTPVLTLDPSTGEPST